MRLIDADALIKETTEVRCANCGRRKGMKNGKMTFVYEIGDVPCRACDVMDMIDVLEEAPTVGGWVSVKDRLPENQEPVIVYVPPHDDDCIGYVGMAYYTRFGEGFWGGTDGNLYGAIGIIHPPTHWMPVPEMPKEVTGDA